MPFLAPLAIQAGASIGSSLLGSKLAGGANKQQQAATQGLQQTQQQGLQTSQNLFGMGRTALQPSMNYWANLLSGNRAEMTSAVAPEINQISEGYQAQRRAAANLLPRGGGRATLLGELPYRQTRDVSTLLQTLRPQAAQQLGAQGQGLLSQANQALLSSTSAGRDILTTQAQERARQAEQGGKIGGGLFDIFNKYGMPGLQSAFPSLFGGGEGSWSVPGTKVGGPLG